MSKMQQNMLPTQKYLEHANIRIKMDIFDLIVFKIMKNNTLHVWNY